MYWYSGCGRIELNITKRQALSASHPGACDEDVKALSQVPGIARQLRKVDATVLVSELRGYGAWDEDELKDHEQNLRRVLWLACCDITEGNRI